MGVKEAKRKHFFDIKSEIAFDINDGVREWGLERSCLGSITHFMSLPNTSRVLFNKGRRSNSLTMNWGSSKLGASIFTNKMGI